MENILKKSSHGGIAQLHFIQMQPWGVSTTPLDLQQILDRYACVFAEPVGLPPSRPEDHRIPLLPESVPPNIRTYRYLFHHKTEIEMLVRDLLKAKVRNHGRYDIFSFVLHPICVQCLQGQSNVLYCPFVVVNKNELLSRYTTTKLLTCWWKVAVFCLSGIWMLWCIVRVNGITMFFHRKWHNNLLGLVWFWRSSSIHVHIELSTWCNIVTTSIRRNKITVCLFTKLKHNNCLSVYHAETE